MYRAVNRGDTIGGWTVLGFDATHARLEKSTPHQCHIEEGILISACNALGVDVEVRQERCVRDGGESCVMVVTPASATDRWTADSPAAGAPAEPAAEESAPGVRRTG
ncbi:MAG: hypothetical protein MUC96_37560 [Myxococcaceae bacterium]|jgi:hypothetical protein|nr:hypothetical protein [Myxococcaceae bacterium]